ncbi:MAG: hypothetical protein IJ744_07980 [Lachnospiraceae bacterium]|nr:hypothetical protein [Lachnospiraceae bacterium]
MGLFKKKKEDTQIKDALKELEETLATVHASVARVRAEESRARVKLHNAENELDDQRRFLARAKAEDRPTTSYEAKIAELEKKVEKLKNEYNETLENLEHVESLEKELSAQKDQVAYLKTEKESFLDDAYYYAESPNEAAGEATENVSCEEDTLAEEDSHESA